MLLRLRELLSGDDDKTTAVVKRAHDHLNVSHLFDSRLLFGRGAGKISFTKFGNTGSYSPFFVTMSHRISELVASFKYGPYLLFEFRQ